MNFENDRSVEKLIRLGGEREMPSSGGMERARTAAEESWRRGLEQASKARRNRWRMPFALAAAASAAALALWLGVQREPPPIPFVVAQVAAVEGAATFEHAEGSASVATGSTVLSGTTLVTGGGRVATSHVGGLSLRLDRGTRVQFDGPESVTLIQGTVYVDSGGLNAGSSLTITTPAGEVTHVGTQFLVSVSNDATRVRVREGRVLLKPTDAAAANTIAAGEELEVRGDAHTWRRGLPSFGPPWEVFSDIAPNLEIEGRPLAEFLAWLAREHGWQLRYSTDALQQRTHEIRLHGSVDGLDTPSMLERMTLVTGLAFDVRDGVLFVGEYLGPMR